MVRHNKFPKDGSIRTNDSKQNSEYVPNLYSVSRRLTRILRHSAVQDNIPILSTGYVKLSDLQKLNLFSKITIDDFKKIVEEDNKNRFHLYEDSNEYYIRANQGHSIKHIQIDMEELKEPINDVIHGTYYKSWDLIFKEGLSKMTRQHIHFATGLPKDKNVISGMRTTCELYIYIDMKAAMEDGIKFYKSMNEVILTEGENGILNPKYFKKVIDKDKGIDILEKIKQL